MAKYLVEVNKKSSARKFEGASSCCGCELVSAELAIIGV